MGQLALTWWNLENFFDTEDDPISKDFDYTPANGWTPEAFNAKKANLAAALMQTHGGSPPDILAVCEIEKDGLLAEVVREMGAKKLGVVRDRAGTSDLRGIDVAVAYNRDKLAVERSASHVVHLRYRTRDIFEVVFRVKESGERLVVIASHWPSRSRGRWESEPARIAVAENIAYIVEEHLKVPPAEYESLRTRDELAAVQAKWNTKLLVVGDFNDEPEDRSVVEHLKATRELDRVVGTTNEIRRFSKETADYRAEDVYLYNAVSHLRSAGKNLGSYYFAGGLSGETTNRYLLIDQLVVSRGLLAETGLRLARDSVAIFDGPLVATPSARPRPFDRKSLKGTSDHLPLTARFDY